jgi:hypothetical protein
MRIDFNNLDGEVMSANDSDGLIEYDAPLALSPVKGNPLDRDNFYFADGDTEYYYAGGKRRKKRKGGGGGAFGFLSTPEGRKRRQARRDERIKQRQERAKMRVQAKVTDAEGRRLASEGLAKEDTSTAQLAAALGGDTSAKARKAGGGESSNNTLYYVLGGIALLGVGFVVYKSMKKGK